MFRALFRALKRKPAADPAAEPEDAPGPRPPSRRRHREHTLFLLIITMALLAGLLAEAGTVQVAAAVVNAVCAVWQLLRGGR
ncbi:MULTISPECIES: hypothetical protein [Streptomyces]|uniref:hypothetical protein n=1 Tax=Streptomyces TaxID=1883 RepID=UPI00324B867C